VIPHDPPPPVVPLLGAEHQSPAATNAQSPPSLSAVAAATAVLFNSTKSSDSVLMSPAPGGGPVDPMTPALNSTGNHSSYGTTGSTTSVAADGSNGAARGRAPSLDLTVKHSPVKTSIAGAAFTL
jgi:hypothetical protein